MKKQIFLCFAVCASVALSAQNPTLMTSANPVSNITANSAVVSGTVVNPVQGDTLLVWVSVLGGPYQTDTIVITSNGPTTVAIQLSMLASLTPYSNAQLQGTLVQSGVSGSSTAPYGMFTTLASQSTPQITFPNAAIVTPYTMKARFHYNYGCPTPTQTRLNWGLTPALGTYSSQFLLIGAGDSSFTINGLSPLTTVYYRVETISNCAVSASAIQSAVTIAVPAPYSTCANAVNVTYHSADIPFTVQPGSAYAGSNVTKIKLIATYAGGSYADSIVGSYNSMLADSFHLDNLPGNTNVSYVLQFYNASGAMDYCTRYFITAAYPAPPQVVLGNVTGVSSCNAHVPVIVTAPIAGSTVRLFWKHESQNGYDSLYSKVVCTSCTTGTYLMEVTPLLQENGYHVRAEAYVVSQSVGYSNQLGFTTLQGGSPTAEILGEIRQALNGLEFDYSGSGDGYATTGTVKVYKQGVLVASPTVSLASCSFTGTIIVGSLASCTVHDITFEVESIGGVGGDSSPDGWYTGCAGIDDIANTVINVYPNPTSNNVTIEGLEDQETVSHLIDMNGKRVFSSNHQSFSVDQLPSGIYSLQIVVGNSLVIKKIIIRH